MSELALDAALKALTTEDRRQIEAGLEFFEGRLAGLPDTGFHAAVERLFELFLIDTLDHPELEPLHERAVLVLAQGGTRVIPHLIEEMENSDLKSHLHLAQVLGRIGMPAVPRLRDLAATAEDPYTRVFALFALGKVADPAVAVALPEAIGSLIHPDKEVRDSAARALGKLAEIIPAAAVSAERRAEMFGGLFRALSDLHSAVRAKAMRSLGKMAAAGYLTADQTAQLEKAALRLLGEDEDYDWDRAFTVRRQAEEALKRMGRK